MTRILISNRVQRDFAMVPNSLWASDLSFAAKGVACYLLSLRDGSMPYVAEMEQALGLGRDARRKAFAALEAFGFLQWQVSRNARGAIFSKTLILDALVFDRAPENQAVGQSDRPPENPAGGFSVPARVETRPCNDGISGDTTKQNKTKAAASRVAAVRPVRRASPLPFEGQGGQGSGDLVKGLNPFQRSSVLQDRSFLLGSAVVQAGSPQMLALRSSLRSDCLEQGGAL
jgi:hypothetical protein